MNSTYRYSYLSCTGHLCNDKVGKDPQRPEIYTWNANDVTKATTIKRTTTKRTTTTEALETEPTRTVPITTKSPTMNIPDTPMRRPNGRYPVPNDPLSGPNGPSQGRYPMRAMQTSSSGVPGELLIYLNDRLD